jgi:hypothetical protein
MDDYQKACVAYERHCEQHDLVYQQPDWHSAGWDEGYVTLRNVSGELARYNIATRQIEITAEHKELA